MCEDLNIAESYVRKATSSKHRNIPFELTLNEYKILYNTKKCQYTGIDISHEKDNWSIDRIDNSIGYLFTNTVACCKELNMKKGDLNIDEIKNILKVWQEKQKHTQINSEKD